VTGVNPHRLSAALFGAFYLVVLALRQQGGVRRDENHSKIARRQVQAVFTERIFVQASKIAQRILTFCKRFSEAWAEIRP
jgi:hypothetical protein